MALQIQFSIRISFIKKIFHVNRCCFLFLCSSNKPFWSDNGMTYEENNDDNFITCLTDHLTSFAVLIDYNNDDEKIQVCMKGT